MATAPVRAAWTVDDLLAAVKQLSAADLREFQRQLAAWSRQHAEPNKALASAKDEETLLLSIRENSALPAPEQHRFNRLRRKRQAGTLTGAEEKQLQDLWRQVEQRNAARLEALAALARQRGTDVRAVMRQLGLSENHDVL